MKGSACLYNHRLSQGKIQSGTSLEGKHSRNHRALTERTLQATANMASIVEKRGDTIIYRAPNSVDIPSLDLLSFLFKNPQNDRLRSDTILHADAANPSRNVTTAQQISHLQRLAHTIRTQYGIRDGDAVHVILTGHILCPSVFLGIIAAGATVACSLPTSSPVDIAR